VTSEREFPIRRNDTSELRPLSRWIASVASAQGLPPRACHDIDLCLHEAVSNIIRHGCADDREHHVKVRFEDAPAGIEVQLEDDAIAFDPSAAPAPPAFVTLDQATATGRGIVLMRALTREMRYESVKGRNRLTLVFDREPRP
jgi:serine/threonine-protein kinase RsbW